MPELPEVETVKKVVGPLIIGRTITQIDVLRKQTILGDVNIFISSLLGAKCMKLTRIGKYLIFHFDNGKVLISHLRMEGKFYELLPGEPDTKYARVVFYLDNGHRISFDDMRCFGIMKLEDEKTYKNSKELSKLGPEPFDIDDVKEIYEKHKNRKTPIKTALLSQEIIAGLGNIYVDEVLFVSKIHPHTPTNLVSLNDWAKLIENSVNVLNDAIKAGGSTIKSYHPGKGISGDFQLSLKVYGKAGEKCTVCGSILRKTVTGGRGTTFCPHCQIKRGAPISVAVTGRIASGKTTVLNIFRNNNIPTLSSDEIVEKLYRNGEVIKTINEKLKTSFVDEINKDILRDIVYKDEIKKRLLENIVHPLVKEEIIKWLRGDKSPIKIVEVPLLFESKMDRLFDYIIAVESSKKEELLKDRSPKSASKISLINSTNQFESYKNKVDFLIDNNGSIDELRKKVEKIISKLKSYLN
jgi:formamidopyrimidine-DNA glycosylase